MFSRAYSFIMKHTVGLRVTVASLLAFLTVEGTQMQVTLAAKVGFSDYAPKPKNGNGTISSILASFIVPYQGLAAVILILCAITCGIKIGASSILSQPGARTAAMIGLFMIVIGGVVVINAQSIVGMANGVNSI